MHHEEPVLHHMIRVCIVIRLPLWLSQCWITISRFNMVHNVYCYVESLQVYMFNYLYHRSVKILCWKVNKNYSSHSSTLSKYSQDWLDIFLKRFDCVQNNWIADKTIGLNLLWDLYSEIKHKTHQIKRWADQCICNDQAWIKLIQWGVHHTFIHNRFWSCIDSCDVDTWVL